MPSPNPNPQLEEARALHQKGELAEAAALYQKILESDPENADAWHLLGVTAQQQGKAGLAASLIKNAISLNAEIADFHSNLGKVHQALGEEAAADEDYRRALELNPRHIKALSNLAGLLRSCGEFSAAVDYAKRAVAAGPDDAEAHNNLGNALKDTGWLEDAIASYRIAIELAPGYALAHWNLSLALLASGLYKEGFQEMKWRWQWGGFPAKARAFEQPLWQGEDISAKRILLYAEQGLGDTIHFIRYAARLREKGAKVIFECPDALLPLLAGADLVDELVPVGEPLPDFDVHAALLDLPLLCGTQPDIQPDTLPGETPYVTVPPDVAASWQSIVAKEKGLKIGLNWRGNPASPVERFRGLAPAALQDLAALKNITWFSLQKGDDPVGVPALAENFPIIETGPDALVETAGLICALDLVITSDTAVAHLAGALGKPVWILLHHAPDWRWRTEGCESAWYPTARLFRQKQPGAWEPVIAEVTAALGEKLG